MIVLMWCALVVTKNKSCYLKSLKILLNNWFGFYCITKLINVNAKDVSMLYMINVIRKLKNQFLVQHVSKGRRRGLINDVKRKKTCKYVILNLVMFYCLVSISKSNESNLSLEFTIKQIFMLLSTCFSTLKGLGY